MIATYTEYKQIIRFMMDNGRVTSFAQWDLSNAIILRHDVDLDIDSAYELSKIEVELGVRSSYFFLLNCDTYNVFSMNNRQKLKEMADLGFEIGLHFDPSIYGNVSHAKLAEYVEKESQLLFEVSGFKVKTISLHNPSVLGNYPLFSGYNNAYDESFFSDDYYLSDSRMDFNGKDPYQFIKKVKTHTVQVLLHPLHYSEKRQEYPEIFRQHVKRYVDKIDEDFSINSKYASQMSSSNLFSYVINNS
jgi:hypothetical protein